MEWDFDYDEVVPPNAELAMAELTAKAGAFVALSGAGFDGNAVREAVELPESLGTWTKPEPQEPAGPAGGDKGKKTKPKDLAPWVNPANSWPRDGRRWATFTNEADPAEVLGEQWQAELDALVEQWQAEVSPAQRDAATDAVEQTISSGDLAALAALVVPVLGAGLLLTSMASIAAEAAAAVVAEAAAAGVTIGAATVSRDALQASADAAAALLAGSLGQAAGREALRLSSSGTAAEVAVGVGTYLEGLSDRALRDGLGAELSRALNRGRLDTYAAGQTAGYEVRLYADERLDASTCAPCREIDGTLLPTLDAANVAYGGAGYLWCEGGVRCRGTVRGEWEIIDGA